MTTDAVDIIAIPLGTRLTSLVRLQNGEVHVWIANRNRSVPYPDWQGTYIRIEPNGRVTRVTIDDQIAHGEDIMVLKDGDTDV